MKVLVVDDSKAMRMIIARELGRCEIAEEVFQAESAVMAAQVLQDTPVDLILSDWNMPGESGLEFLTWLRTNGWDGHFGFITSESGATTTKAAMEAGAAFVVRKPFNGADLSEAILQALGRGPAIGRAADGDRRDDTVDDDEAVRAKLAAILEGTLRCPVTVSTAVGPPPRSSARVTADYVDTDGVASALCIVDAPLAAATGAALSMFSPQEAASWAQLGTLPKDLTDNYYEVANILAQLGGHDGRRCLLSELLIYAPGEQLLEVQRLDTARGRVDCAISVDGYGGGRLSFVWF